jgi:hypothetical protein
MGRPVRTDEGAQDLSSLCSLPCGNSGRRRPAAVSVAFLGAPSLAALTRRGGGSQARIGDPETLGRSRVGLPKPVGTDARGTIVHLSAWKFNWPNGLVARGGRAPE